MSSKFVIQTSSASDENEVTSQEWKNCCRICFSGKSKGRLISICKCKGSLGLVHKDCQQKWLTVKKTTKCELCNTDLNAKRVHKDFKDWLNSRDNTNRCYLIIDFIKGLIVLPTTLWTIYLVFPNCLRISNSIITSILLILSVTLLILMACLWFAVCFDHHLTAYQNWRSNRYKYVLTKRSQRSDDNGNGNDNQYVADSDNGIALISSLRLHPF